MRAASTSCAPTHSTTTTLANTRKITIAVSTPRAFGRRARCGIGAARPRRRSAPAPTLLIGEGLQRAHRADHFAGIGRRLGQRVLRRARRAGAPRGRSRPAAARSPGSQPARTEAAGWSPPSCRRRRRTAPDCAARSTPRRRRRDLIWVVSAVSRDTIRRSWRCRKRRTTVASRCANTSARRSATMRSPRVVTR